MYDVIGYQPSFVALSVTTYNLHVLTRGWVKTVTTENDKRV